MLVNNSENKVATGGNGAKTVSMAAKEVQSRVDRKNNIMLYNMPESTGNLKDDVLTHDLDIISELCDNIGISIKEEDVVNMRRLGKRVRQDTEGQEQGTVQSPRPLLVSLTEHIKPKVMKNVYKLKDAREPFNKVSVKHDMTKEEREHEKNLRTEAKRLQEEDKTGNFLFVVRGMPWEQQIRKIKLRKQNTKEGDDLEASQGPSRE